MLSWVGRVAPDNHDLISMKLYQLTVHRTPEEEQQEEAADEELELPIVENMEQFRGEMSLASLSHCEVHNVCVDMSTEIKTIDVFAFF